MSTYVSPTAQLVVEVFMRDFTITDPDGFGLRFGARLTDK